MPEKESFFTPHPIESPQAVWKTAKTLDEGAQEIFNANKVRLFPEARLDQLRACAMRVIMHLRSE